MSWSFAEEMRANRAQTAEIRRADKAAAREQDRADRVERDQRAEQRRERRRTQRREAWRARRQWVAQHPVEVLSAAIIVVPALLAWTSMAAFGGRIYGPLGALLPLFTEAAMWAFAFRLQVARSHDGAPTGWLQVGLWAFTSIAGVLNGVHGYATGGVTVAVLMAVVSTGGVVAHQILTATPMRPRRTRQQRQQDELARQARARVVRMQRAAIRTAIGHLDADGSVELIHQPGTVTVRRRWWGPLRLARVTVPGYGLDAPEPTEAQAGSVADEVERWLRHTPLDTGRDTPLDTTPETPSDEPAESTSDQQRDTPPGPAKPTPTSRGPRKPKTGTRTGGKTEARSMDQLRDELRRAVTDGRINPGSAESIRTGLRVGRDRAKQLRDEWPDDGGTPAPAPA